MKKLLAPLALAACFSASAVQIGFPPRAQDSIVTQNLVAAGTATAGSCVAIDARGIGGVAVGVTGTYTGALSGQVTVDNATWTTMAPTPFAPYTALDTPTATIGSGATGTWQVASIAGASQFRVCGLGAMTGSAIVTLQAIEGSASSGGGSSGGGGAVTNAGTFAVQPAGSVAHDGVATSVNPVLTGGYASAAAPTNVSADGDAVRDWNLRSGAKVTQPSYGGILATTGAGNVDTGTPRVTLGTNDAAIAALQAALTAANTQLVSAMGILATSSSSSIAFSTSDAGPVAAGTATATRGIVPVGTYNSTPITVTNTQQAGFQIDANGYLKTAPATALPAGSALIGKIGIDQTTPGTTDSVTVKGSAGDVSVTLTRTADTNAYAANDVLGAATGSTAALSFANLCPVSGGSIMITSSSLEVDASAVISGETSYTLHLYNVTPPSALGDNAAFDLPSGDRASYLGAINLGAPVDLGSTLYVATDGINKQIKCSGTGLFGYLVTVGAYTPTSARVYVINLHAVGL